jgi:TetR/AcrR family transcriptional regulator, regulator of autoinduction and epiphytic fitness
MLPINPNLAQKAPKEPRQLSPEKAAAILAGGMQEFLAHGYAATSMDRVAAAAGVSKATVYSHFQDKQGLFTALIAQLVQGEFRSIFDLHPHTTPPAPKVVLRGIAHRFLEISIHHPQFLNFMRLIIGESGRFPELARIFVQNIERTSFQLLQQYFTDCPQLKSQDPEATARIFIGSLVHFLIVQEMLHGKDIVPMECDRLIDTLLNSILIDESEGRG